MALNLVFALTLVGSLAISLAITVPLTGALIRVRANFNPKSIQLDEEGNASAHTGPVITGFFGMLRRVKKIEVRERDLQYRSMILNIWISNI